MLVIEKQIGVIILCQLGAPTVWQTLSVQNYTPGFNDAHMPRRRENKIFVINATSYWSARLRILLELRRRWWRHQLILGMVINREIDNTLNLEERSGIPSILLISLPGSGGSDTRSLKKVDRTAKINFEMRKSLVLACMMRNPPSNPKSSM